MLQKALQILTKLPPGKHSRLCATRGGLAAADSIFEVATQLKHQKYLPGETVKQLWATIICLMGNEGTHSNQKAESEIHSSAIRLIPAMANLDNDLFISCCIASVFKTAQQIFPIDSNATMEERDAMFIALGKLALLMPNMVRIVVEGP